MNSKYKIIAKTTLLLLISIGMVRCNEGENSMKSGGEILFPDSLVSGVYDVAVSNIDITPAERSLDVSWDAPGDVSRLAYYQVSWQGKTVDTTLHSEPVTETNYTISHLYNDSYWVSIVAVSKDMQKSNPVKPDDFFTPVEDNAAPDNVDKLNIAPVATSVNLSWVNPEDEDFDRTIVKVKGAEDETWFFIDTLSTIETSISVVGLTEQTDYAYSIQTQDYIGNISEEQTGTFKTKKEALLKKLDDANLPLWSIVDFSSQETKGDNGYAANAIDGNDKTFWHTVWNGGDFNDKVTSGAVPQYIVVDLKQEVIPTVIMLYRRDGNSSGPISARIETTLEDPLSKNIEWNDLGVYTLDGQTNNGAILCNLRELKNARYIKINILAVGNNGKYAMLREINVKGLVDE